MAAAADRLELARGLLRRFEDRTGGAPADEGALLPVAAPLAPLLPGGGLRRGSTVVVRPGPGATSLLLALLARSSAGGGWVGVVGRPDLGLVAAAEAGVALERLVLVPAPGADLLAVTVALLDGMDAVVVDQRSAGLRPADRTRLAARARQRGAVLLACGSWPGADLELGCADPAWRGIGRGTGRLAARAVEVRVRSRSSGAERAERLALPDARGGVAALRPVAPAAVAPAAPVAVAG
jgi:hypothetical protein